MTSDEAKKVIKIMLDLDQGEIDEIDQMLEEFKEQFPDHKQICEIMHKKYQQQYSAWIDHLKEIKKAEFLIMTRDEFEERYSTPTSVGDETFVNFDGVDFILRNVLYDYPDNTICINEKVMRGLVEFVTNFYFDHKNVEKN